MWRDCNTMMYRVGLFSLSVVADYVLFVDEHRLYSVRRRLGPSGQG